MLPPPLLLVKMLPLMTGILILKGPTLYTPQYPSLHCISVYLDWFNNKKTTKMFWPQTCDIWKHRFFRNGSVSLFLLRGMHSKYINASINSIMVHDLQTSQFFFFFLPDTKLPRSPNCASPTHLAMSATDHQREYNFSQWPLTVSTLQTATVFWLWGTWWWKRATLRTTWAELVSRLCDSFWRTQSVILGDGVGSEQANALRPTHTHRGSIQPSMLPTHSSELDLRRGKTFHPAQDPGFSSGVVLTLASPTHAVNRQVIDHAIKVCRAQMGFLQ